MRLRRLSFSLFLFSFLSLFHSLPFTLFLFQLVVGPACWSAPVLGPLLAMLFHVYIISMTPFASVQEWNYFCLFMIQG